MGMLVVGGEEREEGISAEWGRIFLGPETEVEVEIESGPMATIWQFEASFSPTSDSTVVNGIQS